MSARPLWLLDHAANRILFLSAAALLCFGVRLTAANETGEQIYRKQCAECHGSFGEGVADKYDEALYGDRSLEELTSIIHKTMPEEKPELCVDENATMVAQYMMATFYTAEARARNTPPRIELSHLTTRQYENTVADLFAEFLGHSSIRDERGLSGTYYGSRSFRRDKKVEERVDATIDFEFGESSPIPDKINASEFSMRWQGSVTAEETGEYEFCVKTGNGARLWINQSDPPLIDAWVSTGGKVTEHRATIKLLGGRTYPLKLDYFKFKDKTASIELRWKPPHRVPETIPERLLSPATAKETFVVTTPFPPDDASVGYERGTIVSKAWDESTTRAAIEIANRVVQSLDEFARTKPGASDRRDRARQFCVRFAELAFRRPLSDEQKNFFIDRQFDDSEDTEVAVKRVVMLVMKSPRFLYLEIGGPEFDDYDIASRLSFALWDSLPDGELFKAAANDQLGTEDQVATQVQRMMKDPRTKSKLREFFHQWLPFEEGDDLAKDTEAYPGFDEYVASDLRTSLELFLNGVAWSESADFRELLLADYWILNERLAKFYEIDLPKGDAEYKRVAVEANHRAGLVTHPFLLAALSYHKSSSPIHRGVFATRRLLNRSLKPPPMAIEFMDSRFDPHLTMREKVTELTKSEACQTCHQIINPLGFSLEHFDAVGRFRDKEKDKPIDASGEYKSPEGQLVALSDARDLAEYAAGSKAAQRGFVEQLFHHTIKQPAAAYGQDTLDQLRDEFETAEFNMQELLAKIVTTAALHRADFEKGE